MSKKRSHSTSSSDSESSSSSSSSSSSDSCQRRKRSRDRSLSKHGRTTSSTSRKYDLEPCHNNAKLKDYPTQMSRKRDYSSSSSSSSDSDDQRRKKRKEQKKIKKEKRRLRKKKKKELKKEKKKMKKAAKKAKKLAKKNEVKVALPIPTVPAPTLGPAPGPPIPELSDRAMAMKPMTKEEWDKRQQVIRKVYDEETGRHRLIKGEGEVLEEIVTRDRHREINRQATRGDGAYFLSHLSSKISR